MHEGYLLLQISSSDTVRVRGMCASSRCDHKTLLPEKKSNKSKRETNNNKQAQTLWFYQRGLRMAPAAPLILRLGRLFLLSCPRPHELEVRRSGVSLKEEEKGEESAASLLIIICSFIWQ